MKTIGAFEAHEDSQMIELYSKIQRHTTHYSIYSLETQLLSGLIDFIEENEDSDYWFVQTFYHNQTIDGAEAYLNMIVKSLIRMFKDNRLIIDKEMVMAWVDNKTFKTDNGILVRYTKNFIALKTLTPTGIMMSLDEYKIVCNELKLNLDTLTSPELLKFITHYENDKKQDFWKRFKSFIVFEESYLVENGLKPSTTNHSTHTTYEIGVGYQKQMKKKDRYTESTIDVFDGF